MPGILFPFGASILALLFVAYLVADVLSKERGSERMIEISQAVQTGANAFLKREYSYIAMFVLAIAILIAIGGELRKDLPLGLPTSLAFICGAVASGLAGYIGMSIATRANCRTTYAAQQQGLKGALGVAISGGAVMGMSVVGISLLGLCATYMLFRGEPQIINGYAMGASLVALFARSGGGIYTKGADMGADLVGKVEAGIPEDDPRNPATIADNVGDNVGDVAGLGSDLLESYVESIIASIAIATVGLTMASAELGEALRMLPLYIASIGIVVSIIGVMFVKLSGRRDPQGSLMGGTYMSAILAIIGAYFAVKYLGVDFEEDGVRYGQMGIFVAVIAGIISGIVIGYISEFFTSAKYKPCLLYTSPSPRDRTRSRMPSSA